MYSAAADGSGVPVGGCAAAGGAAAAEALADCKAQVKGLQLDLHSMRAAKLPS